MDKNENLCRPERRKQISTKIVLRITTCILTSALRWCRIAVSLVSPIYWLAMLSTTIWSTTSRAWCPTDTNKLRVASRYLTTKAEKKSKNAKSPKKFWYIKKCVYLCTQIIVTTNLKFV